jgi:hypothetical protein
MMASEFIKAVQVASVTPGTLQSNGVQPATVAFSAVDGTGFQASVMVNVSDALAQYAVGTPMWLRIDDTQPSMTIPPVGAPASESTATVITATVENLDAPLAQ